MTNIELTDFGYENNFLPSHTKKVLDKLELNIISLDGLTAKSFYLGNEKRKVNIKLI